MVGVTTTMTLLVGVPAVDLDESKLEVTFRYVVCAGQRYAGYQIAKLPADQFVVGDFRENVAQAAAQFRELFKVEPKVFLLTQTEAVSEMCVPTWLDPVRVSQKGE
jgi:hypothetical protein